MLKKILGTVTFLPPESVVCAAAVPGSSHFGSRKLEAALTILLERMERQCQARRVNAMCFFDQGHPEYRAAYRKAQVYLPRGSAYGGWGKAATKNLPLDMFFEDGNMKESKFCLFTQIADLIAYSAFLKIKAEQRTLTDWQDELRYGDLYSEIPPGLLNKRANSRAPADGIVRIRP